MPAAIAYRRAPLLDPAYVPLSDAAVHTAGLQQELTDRVLAMVDVERMNALDAILATKLGGYTQTPPMPDVENAAALLPGQAKLFAQTVRGALPAGVDVELRLIPSHHEIVRAIARAIALDHLLREPLG